MTTKRIILISLSGLIVVGVITGLLLFILTKPVANQATIGRGVKPTDTTEFEKVSGIVGLPIFSKLPSEQNGWRIIKNDTDATYSFVQLEQSNSSCTLELSASQIPFIDKTQKDYALSKSTAVTRAAAEQGTLSDAYIITISTTKEDAQFYSAVYRPKIMLDHPSTTTPTTSGGSKEVTGEYQTFIAARAYSTVISQGSTDNEVDQKGVIPLADSAPAVVLKYSCKKDDFVVEDALGLLKQIQVDTTSKIKIKPSTQGK